MIQCKMQSSTEWPSNLKHIPKTAIFSGQSKLMELYGPNSFHLVNPLLEGPLKFCFAGNPPGESRGNKLT